jgi:hypothetical protein
MGTKNKNFPSKQWKQIWGAKICGNLYKSQINIIQITIATQVNAEQTQPVVDKCVIKPKNEYS